MNSLKRFVSVSACVVILVPSFAFAGDGSEAAKADSGSSFGDKNAGHGLSGPGAVRASMGLKGNGSILSAPVKKNKIAKVPGPGEPGVAAPGGTRYHYKAVIMGALVGAGMGAALGSMAGPAGAVAGGMMGAVCGAVSTSIFAIGKTEGGD